MRILVAVLLFGSAIAVADPAPPEEHVPEQQAPEEQAPPEQAPPEDQPPPPPDTPPLPPGVPPITINITNNNTGNNSNTNDNKQDNQQTNNQDNQQTNKQDNQQSNDQDATLDADQTVDDTPSSVTIPPYPSPLPPLPTMFERGQLSRGTRKESTRWISLAATGDLQAHGRPGVRASIDLLGRRGFTLGIAGLVEGEGREHRERRDDPGAAAIGYLAWTGRLWGLDVRAQVGVGAALGRVEAVTTIARTAETDGRDGTDDDERSGRVTPRAEAALLVGLPLTRNLGAIAGPVVSTSKPDAGRGSVETSMMGGLRYRF